MKLHPRLSRAAVELVTRFETLERNAVATPDGGWSIGYGHTATARQGARVDLQDAEALLLYDLSAAAELVARCTFAPLTPAQFEALTAFAFSIGPANFQRSTTLARINAGEYLAAADEIERWCVAELGAGAQVVDALVRRRTAEKAHFLSLPPGAANTASPLMHLLSAAVEPASTPPLEARSAAQTAADNVQARLRELIPEADPAAESDAPAHPQPLADLAVGVVNAAAVELKERSDHSDMAEPAPLPAPPADAVLPPQLSPAEPPPPPFANDPGPVAPRDPLSEEDLISPAHPGVAPARVEAITPTSGPKKLGDFIRLGLALLGLALFIWAGVAIATGRPSLVILAAGVAGALMMAASLYSALGVRRR